MQTHEEKAQFIAEAASILQRDYVADAPEHRILAELAELPTLSRSLFFDAITEAMDNARQRRHAF